MIWLLLLAMTVGMCSAQVPVCDSAATSYHANSLNCSQYYTCYQGTATLQSCPDQKYFDSARTLCDFPEYVACTMGPCMGTTGLVAVAIPNICTSYTLCVQGIEYNRTCADGTLFDATYGDCVVAKDSTCEENPCLTVDPATATPSTFYPVLNSCNKYIICDKTNPVVRTCVGTTVFSRTVSKCVTPTNYTCPPGTA
ncbi:probable chitinase 10 [Anopheles nili]|uniref:probable chitinase 10 n=1 Tax=Anopheles nili TaxID=185578 RepID=UPI00237AEE81|nr:probable chitinase 10 [Anopheles nili]